MVLEELWAPENLDRVLESPHLLRNLNRIYERIPQTSCRQCGRCCCDSPPVHFIEYVNIYRHVREALPERYLDIARRSLEYFFFSIVDPALPCLFLSDQRCLVYSKRPRVCRIYGLHDPGEDLVESSRQLKEEVASRQRVLTEAYAAYGITAIPRHPFPLCPYVRSRGVAEVKLSRAAKRAIMQQILQLEARAVNSRVRAKGQTFLPFTTHFAYSLFGPTEAQSLQIAILQVYERDPDAAWEQVRSLLQTTRTSC